MSLTLKIQNAQGEKLAAAEGTKGICFVYEPEYQEGDCFIVESSEPSSFVVLQLDDTIAPAFTFLYGGRYTFPVPFGEKRISYSPRSFSGTKHLLCARYAYPHEMEARKNLALNPLDTHGNRSLFPHASANVETRGEAVFAARNAIDGLRANTFHGEWPYSSWGINRDPQAELKLEFGRKVRLDEVVFYLRADFPHDAWWKNATLHFSDGSGLTVDLKKEETAQSFHFKSKMVEWVILDTLIKAEDPSPFPALTQIEFYGTDIP